jgi:hypothetical protein
VKTCRAAASTVGITPSCGPFTLGKLTWTASGDPEALHSSPPPLLSRRGGARGLGFPYQPGVRMTEPERIEITDPETGAVVLVITLAPDELEPIEAGERDQPRSES